MALGAFGLGTPITHTPPLIPPGLSPYTGLSPYSAVSMSPLVASQLYGQSPHPLQQILQALHVVPQQLQHLQQLQYLQQHQLQQLQQILQFIPSHLAQLQQLIQLSPQLIQHTQQPFGQMTPTTGLPVLPPWGISPQIFGAQPSYVM